MQPPPQTDSLADMASSPDASPRGIGEDECYKGEWAEFDNATREGARSIRLEVCSAFQPPRAPRSCPLRFTKLGLQAAEVIVYLRRSVNGRRVAGIGRHFESL
jgi:hypothetical protein